MIMMIMITNGPHSQSWDTWLTNCPGYRKKKEKRSKQSKQKLKQKDKAKNYLATTTTKKGHENVFLAETIVYTQFLNIKQIVKIWKKWEL